MSDYRAIRGVTKTLENLLKRHLERTQLGELGATVELGPPVNMTDRDNAVSLWLYQVERNAELYNQPRKRVSDREQEQKSFPINLHYLITPHHSEEANAHALLGRVLQVLNAYRSVPLTELVDLDQPFSVHFQPLSLEELTRVWDALKEPYHLSIACLAQLVSLDALHPPLRVAPVAEALIEIGQGSPV